MRIAVWKRPLAVGAAVFVVVVALIVAPLLITRNTEPPVTDPPTTTSPSTTTTTAAPSADPEVYDVDWTFVQGNPGTRSPIPFLPILATPTGFLQVVDELGGPKLLRSRDGISWAEEAMPEGLGRTLPEALQLGETYVLADRFLGKVLMSTDGSTWTLEDVGSLPGVDSESCCVPEIVHYEGIEFEEFRTLELPTPFAPGREMYVIGLETGYAAYTLDNGEIRGAWTSRNGQQWTIRALEINRSPLRGLLLIERAFAVRDGQVMAAGIGIGAPNDPVLLTSADGVEWSEVTPDRELLRVFGLSTTSHGWILGGDNFDLWRGDPPSRRFRSPLFFSADGVEWLDLPTPLEAFSERRVLVAGNTVFVFEEPYSSRPDYVVASLDTLTRRTSQE